MAEREQYPYVSVRNVRREESLRPLLPITLQYGTNQYELYGLLDTGADVNVLPYGLGLDLGAVWDDHLIDVRLSGNLAHYEARGILLDGIVANYVPVRLAFAWTRAETVPLILGQVNFFMEFDVCFFRSRGVFEISPHAT
jgi:hypothetical protein